MPEKPDTQRDEPQRPSQDEERIRGVGDQDDDFDETDDDLDSDDADDEEQGDAI